MSEPTYSMYVANTSMQHHILMFALEDKGRVYEQYIPMGAQVNLEEALHRRLTQSEIDFFIKKKGKYGYRNVRELSSEKEFVGMCYSIDAPINIKVIKGNYEHNNDVLNEKRDERLEDSSLAIATMLNDNVAPANTPLRRSSVEVIEETKGNDTPRIGVGVEFTAEGVAPNNNGRRAKKR